MGVGVVLACLLFCTPERFVVGAFNDDGAYVALAKALASGEGYRAIHLAGAPVEQKYPPGVPVLFAFAWWVAGTLPRVQAVVFALNVLAVGAGAGVIWWLGRTWLRCGPVELAVFAIGPLLLDAALQYWAIPVTEPYFILSWAAALALAVPLAAGTDREPGRSPARAFALGAVLAAAALLRTQGVVLAAAIVGVLLLRAPSRRDGMVAAAVALPPVVAWRLFVRAAAEGPVQPGAEPYLAWIPLGDPGAMLEFVRTSAAANVAGYATMFGAYAASAPWVGIALVLVVAALALAGLVREWRARPLLPASVAALGVVVLVWPFTQDRLLIPLLPFAGLCAASAFRAGAARLRRPAARAAAYGALAIAVVAVAGRQFEVRAETVEAIRDGDRPGYFSPGFMLARNSGFITDLSQWVRENTAPDDRILSYLPAGLYLHTGRAGVLSLPPQSRVAPSVFSEPGTYLARRIVENGVSVIVLGIPGELALRDAAVVSERCPDALRLLAGGSGVFPVILRVAPDTRCLREKVLDGDLVPRADTG